MVVVLHRYAFYIPEMNKFFYHPRNTISALHLPETRKIPTGILAKYRLEILGHNKFIVVMPSLQPVLHSHLQAFQGHVPPLLLPLEETLPPQPYQISQPEPSQYRS